MNNSDLIFRAAGLARSAPEAWKSFLGALSTYSTHQTTNLIQSSLESLPVAQGRAQAIAHLLALLEGSIQSADKIEGKRK
jgi:hypothetical protein